MIVYVVLFALSVFEIVFGTYLIKFGMNEYKRNGTNYDVGTIMTCSIGGVLSLAIGIKMLLAVLVEALL